MLLFIIALICLVISVLPLIRETTSAVSKVKLTPEIRQVRIVAPTWRGFDLLDPITRAWWVYASDSRSRTIRYGMMGYRRKPDKLGHMAGSTMALGVATMLLLVPDVPNMANEAGSLAGLIALGTAAGEAAAQAVTSLSKLTTNARLTALQLGWREARPVVAEIEDLPEACLQLSLPKISGKCSVQQVTDLPWLTTARPTSIMTRLLEAIGYEACESMLLVRTDAQAISAMNAEYRQVFEFADDDAPGMNAVYVNADGAQILNEFIFPDFLEILDTKGLDAAIKAAGKSSKYLRTLFSDCHGGSVVLDREPRVLVLDADDPLVKAYDGAVFLEEDFVKATGLAYEIDSPAIMRIAGTSEMVKGGGVIPSSEFPEGYDVICTTDSVKPIGWSFDIHVLGFTSDFNHIKPTVTSGQDVVSMLDVCDEGINSFFKEEFEFQMEALANLDWNTVAREELEKISKKKVMSSLDEEMIPFLSFLDDAKMDVRVFPSQFVKLVNSKLAKRMDVSKVRMDLRHHAFSAYPQILPEQLFEAVDGIGRDYRVCEDLDMNWLIYVSPRTLESIIDGFGSPYSWAFRRPNSFGDGVPCKFVSEEGLLDNRLYVAGHHRSLELMQKQCNGGDWDDALVFWGGEVDKGARRASKKIRSLSLSDDDNKRMRQLLKADSSPWNKTAEGMEAMEKIQPVIVHAAAFGQNPFAAMGEVQAALKGTRGWTGTGANANMIGSLQFWGEITLAKSYTEKQKQFFELASQSVASIMLSDLVDAENQGVVTDKALEDAQVICGYMNFLASLKGSVATHYHARMGASGQKFKQHTWNIGEAFNAYSSFAEDVVAKQIEIGTGTGTLLSYAELAQERLDSLELNDKQLAVLSKSVEIYNSTLKAKLAGVRKAAASLVKGEDGDKLSKQERRAHQEQYVQSGHWHRKTQSLTRQFRNELFVENVMEPWYYGVWHSDSDEGIKHHNFRYLMVLRHIATQWTRWAADVEWSDTMKMIVLKGTKDDFLWKSGFSGDNGPLSYLTHFLNEVAMGGELEQVTPTMSILVYPKRTNGKKLAGTNPMMETLKENLMGTTYADGMSVKVGDEDWILRRSHDGGHGIFGTTLTTVDGKSTRSFLDLSIFKNAKVVEVTQPKSDKVKLKLTIALSPMPEGTEYVSEQEADDEFETALVAHEAKYKEVAVPAAKKVEETPLSFLATIGKTKWTVDCSDGRHKQGEAKNPLSLLSKVLKVVPRGALLTIRVHATKPQAVQAFTEKWMAWAEGQFQVTWVFNPESSKERIDRLTLQAVRESKDGNKTFSPKEAAASRNKGYIETPVSSQLPHSQLGYSAVIGFEDLSLINHDNWTIVKFAKAVKSRKINIKRILSHMGTQKPETIIVMISLNDDQPSMFNSEEYKQLKAMGINTEIVEISGEGFQHMEIIAQTEALARHFKVRSGTADIPGHPQGLDYYYATHDSVCYTTSESFLSMSYHLMELDWDFRSISYMRETIEELEHRHSKRCDNDIADSGKYCTCNYSFISELLELSKARLLEAVRLQEEED